MKTIIALALAAAALLIFAATAAAEPPYVPGLDRSFGNQGLAISAKIPIAGDSISMAAGPGGQVITSTYSQHEHGKLSHSDLFFAEFDATGKPVKRFGNKGVATYSIQGRVSGYQTQIDPQGRVVALVDVMPKTDAGEGDLRLIRLNSKGGRDKSFNHGKQIMIYREAGDFFDQSLKLSKSGEVYVYGGYGNVSPTLFKFSTHGRLVKTYGHRGHASLPVGDDFLSEDETKFVALNDDGSTFFAGSASNGQVKGPDGTYYGATKPLIRKLTPDGKLDPQFGNGGSLVLDRTEPLGSFDALGVTAAGELTAILDILPVPAKLDEWSNPTLLAQRLSATGATAPFSAEPGAPSEVSVPTPIPRPDCCLLTDSRFGSDGSYERLDTDVRKRKYELTTVTGDGTRVTQQPVVTLPRPFESFQNATIDQRDGSLLIGGGQGHRLAVIRLQPPSF